MNSDPRSMDARDELSTNVAENPRQPERQSRIGLGKKLGLYGMIAIILAVIIVALFMWLVAYHAPFRLGEGVGP